MQTLIIPKRQGWLGYLGDMLMLPVMYLLQGNFRESPQRTHRWNNTHLRNKTIKHLHADLVEVVVGDLGAHRRWLGPLPLFHMPIFGGWKDFVVLEPKNHAEEWFVGWVAFDALGVSKIPVTGPVRLGIGPRQAQFFGLTSDGVQIDVDVIGNGQIGSAGEFATIPLL